jgi:hypothetical protein
VVDQQNRRPDAADREIDIDAIARAIVATHGGVAQDAFRRTGSLPRLEDAELHDSHTEWVGAVRRTLRKP